MSEHRPDPATEEEPEIIELVNDEGETLSFELLAVIEVEDALYAALTPVPEAGAPAPESVELHIFAYTEYPPEPDAPEGSWAVDPVEDEELEQRVFAEFQALLTAAIED